MAEPQKGETLGEFMQQYLSGKEPRKRFPKRRPRAASSLEGRRAKLKA